MAAPRRPAQQFKLHEAIRMVLEDRSSEDDLSPGEESDDNFVPHASDTQSESGDNIVQSG